MATTSACLFNLSLADTITIDGQSQLNELLGADCVQLAPGSRLVLSGEIVFGPNIVFAGENRISGPATIEAGCVLTNVQLGRNNVIRAHSVMSDLRAGDGNLFGPFCFIRDDCLVGDLTILGAHVEAARSRFASGVKISHRAFVGDAELGRDTIIGAGSVFCNFDGNGRQSIRIGANVTVGSGTMLVAPLTIGDGAIIAAGSVITKDVAAGQKIVQKR